MIHRLFSSNGSSCLSHVTVGPFTITVHRKPSCRVLHKVRCLSQYILTRSVWCSYALLVMLTLIIWLRCCLLRSYTINFLFFSFVITKHFGRDTLRLRLNFYPLILASIFLADGSYLLWSSNGDFYICLILSSFINWNFFW